jgi:hypothetical protein
MNDSHFFVIEAAQDAAIHAKYITHSLTVRANVSVILDNKELLLKEKYLEGKFSCFMFVIYFCFIFRLLFVSKYHTPSE